MKKKSKSVEKQNLENNKEIEVTKKSEELMLFSGKEFKLFKSFNNYKRKNNQNRFH